MIVVGTYLFVAETIIHLMYFFKNNFLCFRFAFAKFTSEKDAKALIADLNGLKFKGRSLKVFFSKKGKFIYFL